MKIFSYLNLFVFFQNVAVLGSNYVIMFISWEGVGYAFVCSQWLAGLKLRDITTQQRKHSSWIVLVTLVLLGIFLALIRSQHGFLSWSFFNAQNRIVTSLSGQRFRNVVGVTLLLFVGAIGKKVQIPLYTLAGCNGRSISATLITCGNYGYSRHLHDGPQ